ncbi:MAG: hypothetical protein H7Z43_05275 [Clostridia bacterium]|nr:hypothetical protein [Deltaproteobacteria bacterium]
MPISLPRQMLVFGLALLGVIGAAYLAATLAFEVYYAAPERYARADWWGWALNIAAPVLGGAAVAAALSAWEVRRGRYSGTWRGHFARTMLWYASAVALYGVVRDNVGISDFGLWGQFVQWPLAAILGAIGVDALMSVRVAWYDARAR